MEIITVPTYVTKVETVNTGGNCMVDLIHLPDGRVVGINDECVVVYPDESDFHSGEFVDQPSISFDDVPWTFEEFLEHIQLELMIQAAELGADYERDFDHEAFAEKQYDKYRTDRAKAKAP
jgi:hypothetical protein